MRGLLLPLCLALAVAYSLPRTAVADDFQIATPQGLPDAVDGFTADMRKACAPNARKLRTIDSLAVRAGLARGIGGLSLDTVGSGTADSYHCCDGAGNCSEPVNALTICPVIKVWCREEGNACVCD